MWRLTAVRNDVRPVEVVGLEYVRAHVSARNGIGKISSLAQEGAEDMLPGRDEGDL